MSTALTSDSGMPRRLSVRARVPEPTLALLLLALFAPLLLLAAAMTLLSSHGPLLILRPLPRLDGRVSYRTEFRTTRPFDPSRMDRLTGRPIASRTVVGTVLSFTRIALLPALLDVRAGRLRLAEALG